VRTPVQQVDENGNTIINLGRAQGGGAWGYWFCETCNVATGVWDREHRRWINETVTRLRPRWKNGPSAWSSLVISDVDPGAFSRAWWAFMFAVDEELRDLEPEIAKAVRTGEVADPPGAVRVLLALTTSERRLITRRREMTTFKTTNSSQGMLIEQQIPIRVSISAPPFVALLVPEGAWPRLPYFDVGRWITEPANSRRRIAFELPVEITSSVKELPVTVGPDLSRPHRLVPHEDLPEGWVMMITEQ
jgi:hypothetical protein